jgi:hypothetical protein
MCDSRHDMAALMLLIRIIDKCRDERPDIAAAIARYVAIAEKCPVRRTNAIRLAMREAEKL